MIVSPAFRGKRYAVLGLARSGMATVVIRFWIVSFILALAGLATLKLR